MATYIVTGAAGFIGSKVAEMLLVEGHNVIGIDNLNDAYDVRLKNWRLERIKHHPNFDWRQIDICDRDALQKLASGFASVPDGLINLAARAGVRPSVEHPWIYMETNAIGTLNLLELCRRARIPKFVLASTSSLYGARNPQPYREDANTNNPLSPYTASKKAAEAMCFTYHHLHEIDISIFRYFTVYGPAGRPDMSPFRFVQWISEGRPVKIFGDGQQSRDFTYVDDIARGTIAGLKRVGFEVFNLGSDTPIVLMESIRLIEKLVGASAVMEHSAMHCADMRATWADISKAENVLGWRPQIGFEEGFSNLVEWYRENREWAKDIRTVD